MNVERAPLRKRILKQEISIKDCSDFHGYASRGRPSCTIRALTWNMPSVVDEETDALTADRATTDAIRNPVRRHVNVRNLLRETPRRTAVGSTSAMRVRDQVIESEVGFRPSREADSAVTEVDRDRYKPE